MKIRKKLFLGFGLLFVVVLFFGVVSMYYVGEISETAKVTLRNNYETLTFTRDMRSALDESGLPLSTKAAEAFDKALKQQEDNITETGEKEATAGVRNGFRLLINPSISIDQKERAERDIRSLLKTIESLNMQAIVQKNNTTHATVNKATLYLGAMGFITFLILFVLIANFPGFIIDPLHQFAGALQEISRKNYDTRLNFQTSNEFTELSDAFNNMAAVLSDAENKMLARILSEEARVKAMVEEMPNAVIGVNEKQEVLFINTAAKNILHLNGKQLIGKALGEFAKSVHLIKLILENKNLDDPLKVTHDGKDVFFQQRNLEIVVPNIKPNPFDTVQFSGYTAGTIYILKDITELKLVDGEQ
jgi:two-component system, NtrC family, sensor histidine kinase KinB